MPYERVADLPDEQVDQYTMHQRQAFLEAFNHAYEEYDGDESRAFATAHAAAQRTPEHEPQTAGAGTADRVGTWDER